MLKNKIPLSSIVGFNLCALGVFFLIIGISVSQDLGNYLSAEDIIGLLLVMGGGSIFLLGGIGFLLKKKWARIAINVVLYISFALLAIGLYFFIASLLRTSYWSNRIEQSGVFFFGICSLLGIFLFINNSRVISELEQEDLTENS